MICEECGFDKPLVADRGHGIRRCVDCSEKNYKSTQRAYYERNREAVKQRTTLAQTNRLAAWVEYFKSIHGDNLACECCGISLAWPGSSTDKTNIVHFDHRHGGIASVKKSPTKWIRSRWPTDDNKRIFDACDFGLLCNRCNRCLPTERRGEWLLQALEYHGKK